MEKMNISEPNSLDSLEGLQTQILSVETEIDKVQENVLLNTERSQNGPEFLNEKLYFLHEAQKVFNRRSDVTPQYLHYIKKAGLDDLFDQLMPYTLSKHTGIVIEYMDKFKKNLNNPDLALGIVQQEMLHSAKKLQNLILDHSLRGQYLDAFVRFIANIDKISNPFLASEAFKHLGDLEQADSLREFSERLALTMKRPHMTATQLENSLNEISAAYVDFNRELQGFSTDLNFPHIAKKANEEIERQIQILSSKQ